MGSSAILAAMGCGQMGEVWRVFERQSVVVFGTLDEPVLARLHKNNDLGSRVPVYFYQSG